MKKEVLLLSVFVLFLFGQDINQTECYGVLDRIPSEYYDGLKSMTIISPPKESGKDWISYQPVVRSYYFWYAQRIKIFNGCDMSHIRHELAHHKNHMDGYSFRETIKHKETFNDALKEVMRHTT